MFNTTEEYLEALRNEMKDADPALLQDAQADAREHFSTALAVVRDAKPNLNETDVLKTIIEEYGTPEETAAAYREVERRTSPALKQPVKSQSAFGRFLWSVYGPACMGCVALYVHCFCDRRVLLYLGRYWDISFCIVFDLHLWFSVCAFIFTLCARIGFA